ncbi:MAG: holo-ACP synthase [Solirubrobacterales bacterium]|nr:holo-ACP synthase [Solirubrobacterales bacterium]
MPVRVGIDLVSAESVRESISAHGARYLERVFSADEVSDCSTSTAIDAERLAARFAAKEAAFKVLRVGDEAVTWRDIEVRRDRSGWVELSLTGRAATLASAAGISDFALSLTHEQGLAGAVVVAEIPRVAEK